jgi:hypothetical protein
VTSAVAANAAFQGLQSPPNGVWLEHWRLNLAGALILLAVLPMSQHKLDGDRTLHWYNVAHVLGVSPEKGGHFDQTFEEAWPYVPAAREKVTCGVIAAGRVQFRRLAAATR